MNYKQLRQFMGLTQQEFAKRLGVDQGSLSSLERGRAAASTALHDRIVSIGTPTVLFMGHSPFAPCVVRAMQITKQINLIEHESDPFYEALRQGKSIAVITNDKAPFMALIDKALAESGLPAIPTRGLRFNEIGLPLEWND